MKTLCFTGKRPKELLGYSYSQNYAEFIQWLSQYLETLYYDGITNFISGGAQGFDQLAFSAVALLKAKYPDIRNIVYVPFSGQHLKWSTNPNTPFSQSAYNQMLSQADEVKYLYEVNPSDFGKVRTALMNRNHDMVDASDIVVALYPNDDYQSGTGGTAECMRYATKQHKTMYQIKYIIQDNRIVPTNTILHYNAAK